MPVALEGFKERNRKMALNPMLPKLVLLISASPPFNNHLFQHTCCWLKCFICFGPSTPNIWDKLLNVLFPILLCLMCLIATSSVYRFQPSFRNQMLFLILPLPVVQQIKAPTVKPNHTRSSMAQWRCQCLTPGELPRRWPWSVINHGNSHSGQALNSTQ